MNKILIGLYEFDGAYSIDLAPLHQPGILAILRHGTEDLEILQLKAADDVNALWTSLQPWYRRWDTQELSMAIYYMPGLSRGERNRVVRDILDEFDMAAA